VPRPFEPSPSTKFSMRVKTGATSRQLQPRQPICAQVSKSSGWPRTQTRPLIELDPPSSFPRGTGITRLAVLGSGSDW
jgi:hypothetical protein